MPGVESILLVLLASSIVVESILLELLASASG